MVLRAVQTGGAGEAMAGPLFYTWRHVFTYELHTVHVAVNVKHELASYDASMAML